MERIRRCSGQLEVAGIEAQKVVVLGGVGV
jgi:hypothetical protein